MGRAVRTKGQRRIGRTIRKLEASVELSPKEAKAKAAEIKYKRNMQREAIPSPEDSPVQNIADLAKKKQNL
jgi:hypothetical protein